MQRHSESIIITMTIIKLNVIVSGCRVRRDEDYGAK